VAEFRLERKMDIQRTNVGRWEWRGDDGEKVIILQQSPTSIASNFFDSL